MDAPGVCLTEEVLCRNHCRVLMCFKNGKWSGLCVLGSAAGQHETRVLGFFFWIFLLEFGSRLLQGVQWSHKS